MPTKVFPRLRMNRRTDSLTMKKGSERNESQYDHYGGIERFDH